MYKASSYVDIAQMQVLSKHAKALFLHGQSSLEQAVLRTRDSLKRKKLNLNKKKKIILLQRKLAGAF